MTAPRGLRGVRGRTAVAARHREQHDQPPGQVSVSSSAAATVHMSPQPSLARQAQSAGVLGPPSQLEGKSWQS